jgi:uncharacterized lipoprotein
MLPLRPHLLASLAAHTMAAGIAGCITYVPPAVSVIPGQFVIHAPYDQAWSAMVTYFADTKVAIQTMDKASGVMASQPFAASKEWLSCGARKGGLIIDRTPLSKDIQFTLFVGAYGDDSTTVRFNVSGTTRVSVTDANGNVTEDVLPCTSTGKFEAQLVDWLRGAVLAEK